MATPDDILAAAAACRRSLEPMADRDWERPAGDLEWFCRQTLAHMMSAVLYYSVNLATRSKELRYSGQTDVSLPVAELLDALER